MPLCLLPACTQAPSFTVTDVRMTGASEAGYVLTFTLEGKNPNKTPLPLREVHYALSLDGDRVFEGSRSAQATIPSKGTQTITLPVAIRNGAAGLGVGVGKDQQGPGAPPPVGETAKYRIAGSIEYLLPGSIAELLFDNKIRRPKAGFEESGKFEFTGDEGEGSGDQGMKASDGATERPSDEGEKAAG